MSWSAQEENMEVRLDARTTNADETRALGIEVGDFCYLDPRAEMTDTGFVRSRHLDDKASVACLYGAVKAMYDAGTDSHSAHDGAHQQL